MPAQGAVRAYRLLLSRWEPPPTQARVKPLVCRNDARASFWRIGPLAGARAVTAGTPKPIRPATNPMSTPNASGTMSSPRISRRPMCGGSRPHWPHPHRAARGGLAGGLRVARRLSDSRDCGWGVQGRRSTLVVVGSGDRRSKGPRFCANQTQRTRLRKGGRPRSKYWASRLPLAARLCEWAEDHRPAVCAEILTKSAGLSSKFTLGEA
jgi:hypothetical protein